MAAAVFAGPVPPCAGRPVATAVAVRTEKPELLILQTGAAVRLEGIRLPDAALDRAPRSVERQATAALGKLIRKKRLALYAAQPYRDRYGRMRVQAFDESGVWLQVALLAAGWARADPAPDRGECMAEFYAAEAEARAARRGLWAFPAYAVRTPDNVGADVGTFQIVTGRVLDADIQNGRAFLNFGEDWKNDFTITISPEDLRRFKRMHPRPPTPLRYLGEIVRARGIVESYNGPEIEVGSPWQIEIEH
mgnify:CR=1 FL=1